ncbi:hypothetical protein MMC22_008963 [Lobaria immixta]|nr:hypothetical protein [Lobaria immixta]
MAMAMATPLVELREVERLSPLVIRILGGNPGKVFTLQGTNTYLVGKGSSRVLVDTGEGKPSWSAALSSVLSSETATVSDAILTHWHPDHVGGVEDLLRHCPKAKVYKNQPSVGQLNIADGQLFQTEGATLRAFYCPGHTVDHMALVLEEEDAMFTGDNVLGQGTAVFEDLPLYLDSLQRMEKQFGGRAYPGHGPVIADGRSKIEEYIKHRQQREEEVLKVLRDAGAPRTARDLVKIIYKDVPENLHDAAERGVVQILEKLRKEGKVEKTDDGKWQIVPAKQSIL